LIRPIAIPTKPIMTNVRMSGLSTIAPTKEPIHETADVMNVPTFPRMVATVVVGVVLKTSLHIGIDMTQGHKDLDCQQEENKTNQIADRFRKQESRELLKKPQTEIFHRLQNNAPPSLNMQNRTSMKIRTAANHT